MSLKEVAVETAKHSLSGKKWYTSKTIWVNTLALAAVLTQKYFDFSFSPEYQIISLAFINLILRKVTKEEVIW